MAIFTNQATLSYQNTTVTSNVATGELVEALTATKTAIGNSFNADSDISYVINIINSGGNAITGVTVSDNLGSYPFGSTDLVPLSYVDGSVRLFVNGIQQTSPTVTVGTGVVFSGITIPAGGNASLIYEAKVTDFAPLGTDGTITNTATITGNGIATPVTVQETINATVGPILTISKSISPAQVTQNSQVTYTFLIQNFGNTEAAVGDNLTITDTFNPILAGIAVALNGTPLAEGTGYTYDEAIGLFTTVPGVITVPAATFTQNPITGVWETVPGSAVLTVTGTI